MSIKIKALKKSPWVFHAACSPCNNCDIEILDVLTPRFDAERFGIIPVGSIRHADCMLVTGVPNSKTADRIKKVYEEASKPCLVVAIGTCALNRGIFKDSYNSPYPLDKIIPVDVYVPGCPPKPEAIILGVVKALKKLDKSA